ncbi:MAG: ABC transporter ATP-binding protein [Mycoplasmatales bacterium]
MIGLFKHISWYIKEQKKMYTKLIILIMFISFLTIIPPKLIGLIIDKIASNTLTVFSLSILGGALIFVPLIIFLANKYYHYNLNLRGQVLSRKLRIIYLAKLFASDIDLYENYNKGELIARISNDLLYISQAATVLMSDLIYCLTLILFIFLIMIFNLSFKLTIVAFLIIPIAFYILNLILKHMRKYYFKHRKIFEKFFNSILESVEGMRLIRGSTYEEEDFQKNQAAINEDIESWTHIVKFETIFTPFFELVIAISTFLTFFYGTYLVINNQMSAGDLITFSVYITMVNGPLLVLANVYNIANQASIASERFFKIMNTENQVIEATNPKALLDFQTIKFDNVSFKYKVEEEYVLNNISFSVQKGQKVAFVGPTGSGKSTLVKHLLRDFNPTQGDIYIDEENIKNYKIKDILQLIGYVPQIHTLFQGTIKENLELAVQEVSYEDIFFAINSSEMQEDLQNMEYGLETWLDEGGRGLSGGQKQRLSIARALIKNPKILILDDSLSAVDTNTEKLILENLKEKIKDKTTFIVSHRFSVVKDSDIIFVLNNGQIIEQGTHQELMQNKNWYYQEYLKQVGEQDVN